MHNSVAALEQSTIVKCVNIKDWGRGTDGRVVN